MENEPGNSSYHSQRETETETCKTLHDYSMLPTHHSLAFYAQ